MTFPVFYWLGKSIRQFVNECRVLKEIGLS